MGLGAHVSVAESSVNESNVTPAAYGAWKRVWVWVGKVSQERTQDDGCLERAWIWIVNVIQGHVRDGGGLERAWIWIQMVGQEFAENGGHFALFRVFDTIGRRLLRGGHWSLIRRVTRSKQNLNTIGRRMTQARDQRPANGHYFGRITGSRQ
jgi:hypothetical protein